MVAVAMAQDQTVEPSRINGQVRAVAVQNFRRIAEIE